MVEGRAAAATAAAREVEEMGVGKAEAAMAAEMAAETVAEEPEAGMVVAVTGVGREEGMGLEAAESEVVATAAG